MLLYLVRHGVAVDPADPECPADPERPLTRKGIEKTRAAMLGLRAQGIAPDVFISSPLLRAVQTAAIAAEILRYPLDKIRRADCLKPDAGPAELWKELASVKAKEVICFGHAPNLDLVIASALGARSLVTSLKKAGVACVELDLVAPPKGRLAWLLPPKILRLLGE